MKQVTILGMGPGSLDMLTVGAHKALEQADLIVGAARLLEGLPSTCTQIRHAATRGDEIASILKTQAEWQSACVVMSGDVGLFSGAKGLPALLQGYEVRILPGIGSAQYLAARLQRPWQGWRFVSAHGVTCNVAAEVVSGGEVFFVTGGSSTAQALCEELCAAGLADVRVTVGEQLSYPEERITNGTAAELAKRGFHPLSVMLVEATPQKNGWQWANSGIPDNCFIRGGVPMTKQEVRAAALAKLHVAEADVLYDIGAGTGSVAVEMALLAKRGRVYAIERGVEGIGLIRQNAERFGLYNLHSVEGIAPAAMQGLPAPDAAFIGGSGGKLAEILAALRCANSAIRLCVACVTLETLQEATALLAGVGYTGFAVCQIAVSRAEAVGGYNMMKALNPVFLVSAEGASE